MASDLLLDFVLRMGADTLALIIDPWRYVFSSNYRRSKHAEWSESPWLGVVQFTVGVFGLILGISAVTYIVVKGLWP